MKPYFLMGTQSNPPTLLRNVPGLSRALQHCGGHFHLVSTSWDCLEQQNSDSIELGMDQYLLIPFLGGWTSIYQLFWCSPGTRFWHTANYYHLICFFVQKCVKLKNWAPIFQWISFPSQTFFCGSDELEQSQALTNEMCTDGLPSGKLT